MRAKIMHGQNVKHRCYTLDIRIYLNNAKLSEAVVPDILQLLSVSAQSLSSAIQALTFFRNASLFHGFASSLLLPSDNRSRTS